MVTRAGRPPVLGFAAFSGTGKTTCLRALLPMLQAQGMRVAVIKHAHHSFDVDQPGKDSYELRKAGAAKVLVASRVRWALMVEMAQEHEPTLGELLEEVNHGDLDLVLVEGFKRERFPKVELHRPSLGHPLLFPDDDSIIAVATDAPLSDHTRDIVTLDLNRVQDIAQFVRRYAAQR